MLIRPREKVVVALGGNALVHPGEPATIKTQAHNVRKAMQALVPLVENQNRLVITHGNGFQVGNILIRVEEALGKAYSIPLELCVAESQGEIGYLIEQSLQNVLVGKGLRIPVLSVLTQVVVDRKDPAFDHPTKPIGPFYTMAQAQKLRRAGFVVKEDAGRGWRKVVASPRPLEIDDAEVLRWILRREVVLIAAGGGGVPVVKSGRRTLHGVPAVVDKDLASDTLARAVGARHLVIVTGEPCVYLDYGARTQRSLRRLTLAEAERHLEAGQFPAGSMGPKIEAAISFLRNGGRQVLITDIPHLRRALNGRAGTVIARRHPRSSS